MNTEKHYIKLAKDHLKEEAKNYNQVQLAIIGEDIHKRSQAEIDKLFNFNIKRL